MVTASHNPPQDNGYKVYAADGAQIVPPADSEIEAAIRAVGPARAIPLDRTRSPCSATTIVDDYVARGRRRSSAPARATLRDRAHRDARRRHGRRRSAVFAAAGFAAADRRCPSRSSPTRTSRPSRSRTPRSRARSTSRSPWPRERDADLVIANDPDADRCAVAVPGATAAWRMLRGDEVGVLLADALLRKGDSRHVRDDDRVVVDARRAGRARTASATPRR